MHGYCVSDSWIEQFARDILRTTEGTTNEVYSHFHATIGLNEKVGRSTYVPTTHIYTRLEKQDDGSWHSLIGETAQEDIYELAKVMGASSNELPSTALAALVDPNHAHADKLKEAFFTEEEPQWYWVCDDEGINPTQPWTPESDEILKHLPYRVTTKPEVIIHCFVYRLSLC